MKNIVYEHSGALRASIIGIALLLIISAQGFAQGLVNKESQVKAAYIYNITKFVNWPKAKPDADAKSLPDSEKRLTICYLGGSSVRQSLQPLTSLRAQGRALILKALSPPVDLSACQLVYVTGSKEDVSRVLDASQDKSCLTVGDSDSFTELGGMIGFTRVKDTIRLKINVTKAKEVGLEISANLLEVAVSIR